jgi:hypothetical protein
MDINRNRCTSGGNPQVDNQATNIGNEPVHQVASSVTENSTDVVVNKPILATPKQISPADGTVLHRSSAKLEWTEVPDATIYGLDTSYYDGSWIDWSSSNI